MPWGISESAYNVAGSWTYLSVRGIWCSRAGVQAGACEELVIAPYATALAAMVDPAAAAANFAPSSEEGGRGAFGFYEALDFTPARLPEDSRVTVVRAYMAHHQGMTLLALANVVLDGMTRRALPWPSDRSSCRASAGGTHTAGSWRLAYRGQEVHRSRDRGSSRPTPARNFRTARLPTPRNASVIQRALYGHDHRRRRRIQQVGRLGDHPMARGSDL